MKMILYNDDNASGILACIMDDKEAENWQKVKIGSSGKYSPRRQYRDDDMPMNGPIKIELRKVWSALEEPMMIGSFTDEGNELMSLIDRQGRWTRVSATVDSGAAANVLPEAMFPQIALKESEGSRKGQYWVAANGGRIANKGEKLVHFQTTEGAERSVKFQVADVTKPLISVVKITEAGNDVILSKSNPRIVNRKTGEVTNLRRESNVFILDMWVMEQQVFNRQG